MQTTCSSAATLAESASCSFFGAKAKQAVAPWRQGKQGDDKPVRLHVIKWDSARNVLQNSLKRVEKSKDHLSAAEITADLRQVQNTIDSLLDLQNQFSAYLTEQGDERNALDSWVRFSVLSQGSAQALGVMAKGMNTTNEAKTVALEIKHVEATLYEQSAYALGKAGRFAESAHLWRASASLAAELVGEAEQLENQELADRLRYEQSTRLLRAKENWNKVSKRD